MIAELGTILASSGFGSVIGGVFGWLNRKEDRKDRENERRFKLEMIQAQANFEQQTSEARAFEESQKTLSVVGDALKSIVRPLITGVLLFQMYIILTSLETITGGIESIPVAEALDLYKTIVLNIISLTATSVSWWFASRPSSVAKK